MKYFWCALISSAKGRGYYPHDLYGVVELEKPVSDRGGVALLVKAIEEQFPKEPKDKCKSEVLCLKNFFPLPR